MKLVLEIQSHTGDGSTIYRTVEAFPLTIGRGYHNDIILNDPHVGATHIRIEWDTQGWSIHDLSSTNGLTVNGRYLPVGAAPLRSGDALRIGQTDIRVFAPDHPVAETVPLLKASPLLLLLERPRTAYLLLLAALFVICGWTWLDVYEENALRTVILTGAAAFAIALAWAGIWAAIGRLVRHRSAFTGHLALASLYILLSTAFDVIQSGVDFLTNESAVSTATQYLLNLLLVSGLVYGALSLAARMTRKRRLLWSGCFAGGLLAGIFLMSLIGAGDFSDTASYPVTLKPYLAQIAPHEDLAAFMAENKKLFESKDLIIEQTSASNEAPAPKF